MRILVLVFLSVVFLNVRSVYSQIENHSDEFILPVKITPSLSGSFGEPRARHFHMGLDFRTWADGKQIYAVADGYISRLRISPWGYGLALYIEHDNGFTSVYAHLSKFTPELDKIARDVQYLKQSFTIDTIPDKNRFRVKQGDIIAYSGNTGQSEGPHLHFEIRDGKTQDPFNLLNVVYDIKDDVKPEIFGVVIYPLCYTARVKNELEKLYIPVKKESEGIYSIDNDDVPTDGNIGIGVDYVDRMTGTRNRYGARDAKLFVNGKLVYHSSVNRLSYSNQNQKNSVFDYEYYLREKKHVQKLFREPNNTKTIFKTLENDGNVIIEAGRNYDIEIHIIDYYDNKSVVKFKFQGSSKASGCQKPEAWRDYSLNHLIIDEACRVEIDSTVLFSDNEVSVKKISDGRFSSRYLIGDEIVALKSRYRIYLALTEEAIRYKDKVFIACIHNKKMTYYDAEIFQNWAFTEPAIFGEFELRLDTTPPRIVPVNITDNSSMKGKDYIEFEITDDLSGISSYNLFINDVWVLAQYEPKDRSIRYYFDEKVVENQEYNLRFVVSDRIGNESEFRCRFSF
jgi:hypothetical protein